MKNLKVLTVKNPYAFLIVTGFKKYEIRSWSTNYRGPLYIHSAKVPVKSDYDENTINGVKKLCLKHIRKLDYMSTHGSIIGKVNLVNILKIDDEISRSQAGIDGCCSIDENDKYAWVLENPEVANLTIPVKGQLGIWSLETNGDTDN